MPRPFHIERALTFSLLCDDDDHQTPHVELRLSLLVTPDTPARGDDQGEAGCVTLETVTEIRTGVLGPWRHDPNSPWWDHAAAWVARNEDALLEDAHDDGLDYDEDRARERVRWGAAA